MLSRLTDAGFWTMIFLGASEAGRWLASALI